LIVFPISMDAVVLAPLDPVVGAALALVVALLFVVVVEEPAGGLAVELQPATTSAAAAGATANAASLRRWSKVLTRIVFRSPLIF
jgi:hypothetical protein